MSTLYEIAAEYSRFMEFEEDKDIDPQAFKDTLEAIEGEFEVKADNCARVIRNLIAEAEMYEKEMKRMEAAANARKNRAKWLKQQIYNSMKATGKLKFKTDLFSFGIRKNSVHPMQIVPDVTIPLEYCKIEPDSTKIREALANGAELPFAVLKERGDHLVIR